MPWVVAFSLKILACVIIFIGMFGEFNMEGSKRAAFIASEYNEKVFYGGGEKVNSYIID